MQGRHRSPVGIGQRMALEDSGHGGGGPYGSSYRNYGRGGKFRRGPVPRSQPYHPPPPPPPPSKDDILMEAGRLAAEYLVARGILPQNSLPPVWQQNGGNREFRGRERERERERDREREVSARSPRTSSLDRLNAGYSDSGHGRRWYADDYSHSGSQLTRGRGKRLTNYSRGHESDWGRESVRSAGWMDRSRSFNENVEDDEDSAWGYRRRGAEYRSGGLPSKAAVESEVVSRGEAVESGSDLDTTDGGSVRANSSSVKDDASRDVEIESNRERDVGKTEDMEIEQGMETESAVVEKVDEIDMDLSSVCESAEMDWGSTQSEDLLKLCRSVKVPTKLRSNRGSKNGHGPTVNEASTTSEAPALESENDDEPTVAGKEMSDNTPNIDEEKKNEVEETEVPDVVEPEVTDSDKDAMDNCRDDSFSGLSQNFSSMSKQDSTIMPVCSSEEGPVPILVLAAEKKTLASTPSFTSSFPKSLPVQHASELVTEASFTADNKTSLRSYSFTGSSSSAHLIVDSCKSLSIPEASNVASEVKMDGTFTQESGKTKRSRDWYSDIISAEDYANASFNGKHFGPQGRQLMADERLAETTNQGKIDGMRLFPKTESAVQAKFEDGPLLSSSFKIRDLNLMGTPEITDISDDPIHDHIPSTPAILQAGNTPSVDFGLSIGNNRRNDIYCQSSNANKEVQVIDLEVDSPIDTSVCDPSKPRNETIYKNLDSFFSNPESAVDLPDIQDGYGHAITDLLGSDITSCSAVAANINSPQPGMTLHGAEEMAGDDDSIYVSLGEIPIGFMDIWDAAPQEYGKFF